MEDAAEEADDPEASLKAERERDEYLALAQRAQADFENYRKRAAKEAAAAGDRAKGGLVRELLPVVDNLERALASAEESEQHLAEGVRLVHSSSWRCFSETASSRSTRAASRSTRRCTKRSRPSRPTAPTRAWSST